MTDTVTLSEQGLKEAAKFQSSQAEFRGKCLRLYLEGKGCDGFFYGVTFDDPEESDVHFPQTLPDASFAIDVIVDPDTLQFVAGSSIEWADDERGRGFVVDNPRQKAFRGKFFKREAWREKLEKTAKEKRTLS